MMCSDEVIHHPGDPEKVSLFLDSSVTFDSGFGCTDRITIRSDGRVWVTHRSFSMGEFDGNEGRMGFTVEPGRAFRVMRRLVDAARLSPPCSVTDTGSWRMDVDHPRGHKVFDGSICDSTYDGMMSVLLEEIPRVLEVLGHLPPEREGDPVPSVPFFHPTHGWMIGGATITDDGAQSLCEEHGIPYGPVGECSPGRRAFLFGTDVAGTAHVPGFGGLVRGLRIGDRLDLVREPGNPHDHLAIAVVDPKGERLGYIPRRVNGIPARLMDSGSGMHCEVSSVSEHDMGVLVFTDIPGRAARRHFRYCREDSPNTVLIDPFPATRGNTGLRPMPYDTVHTVLNRRFSEDDLWNLRWGHRSRTMDDSWIMVYEDGAVHIGRSRTGVCVFSITPGDGDVHDVVVNDDPEQFDHGPIDEVPSMIDDLLDRWLEPVELPVDALPLTVTGNIVLSHRTGTVSGWEVFEDGEVLIRFDPHTPYH